MDITLTQEALTFIFTLPYSDFNNVVKNIIPSLIVKGIRRIDKTILEKEIENE